MFYTADEIYTQLWRRIKDLIKARTNRKLKNSDN